MSLSKCNGSNIFFVLIFVRVEIKYIANWCVTYIPTPVVHDMIAISLCEDDNFWFIIDNNSFEYSSAFLSFRNYCLLFTIITHNHKNVSNESNRIIIISFRYNHQHRLCAEFPFIFHLAFYCDAAIAIYMLVYRMVSHSFFSFISTSFLSFFYFVWSHKETSQFDDHENELLYMIYDDRRIIW